MIRLLGGLWGKMYHGLVAIPLAAAANLVTKLVLPLAVGSWHFGAKLTMVGVLAILSGAGVWLVTVAEI